MARKKVSSRLKGGKDKINRIGLIFESPIKEETIEKTLSNNPNNILKPEIKDIFGPMKIKELIYTE